MTLAEAVRWLKDVSEDSAVETGPAPRLVDGAGFGGGAEVMQVFVIEHDGLDVRSINTN